MAGELTKAWKTKSAGCQMLEAAEPELDYQKTRLGMEASLLEVPSAVEMVTQIGVDLD